MLSNQGSQASRASQGSQGPQLDIRQAFIQSILSAWTAITEPQRQAIHNAPKECFQDTHTVERQSMAKDPPGKGKIWSDKWKNAQLLRFAAPCAICSNAMPVGTSARQYTLMVEGIPDRYQNIQIPAKGCHVKWIKALMAWAVGEGEDLTDLLMTNRERARARPTGDDMPTQ